MRKNHIHRYVLTFLLLLLIGLMPVWSKTVYVAINGSDTQGDGTISKPFAGIVKAQEMVSGGDTVFIRGGTYRMNQAQIHQYSGIWAYQHHMSKSGSSASKRIHYWAYPGEKPIIDMTDVKPAGYRIIVFYVSGSFLHFKGLEIIGTQVTIKEHTQSECFRHDGGNYNIYEQCVMRDGQAIGFYLIRGSHNLVLNCDAYNNWDYTSQTGRGGNVDGFGFHCRKGSVGNVIRGCRAWFNSDDGYDCINSSEEVVFDNCWAFYNGYGTEFQNLGDGNGFKIGGYGQAPSVAGLPVPIPSNLVKFCLAYRNKANGFYANHHVETGIRWYHNTAYRNSTNFNMLSQKITKSIITGNDTTIDCPGIRHELINNVSLKYSTQRDTLNIGTSTNSFNSFSPDYPFTVTTADFESLNESLLIAPRQADGSLPLNGFLRPVKNSRLIDAGREIGLPFNGSAPDIGAFEYMSPANTVAVIRHMNFYPNPASTVVRFSGESLRRVTVSSLEGKILKEVFFVNEINIACLPVGLLLIEVEDQSKIRYKTRLFKI
jgi:hypothetical protein